MSRSQADDQPALFEEREGAPDGVVEVQSRSILTRATGFMSSYDYTLNPYSGCAFGCGYCYAAFFARDAELVDSWGEWVKVKANAVTLLRRMRTDLRGKSIYMSSVTDPYQPVERRLRLVREILEELVLHQPRLVVQTRGPLVTRDVDLFRKLDDVRVNITVTTDSELVRRAFEPKCPSIDLRLGAAQELVDAGVDCRITLTPLLPVEDPGSFAQRLLATGVHRFVVQPFHTTRGRFVAGTGAAALELSERMEWGDERYRAAVATLRGVLPSLEEGKEGFAP